MTKLLCGLLLSAFPLAAFAQSKTSEEQIGQLLDDMMNAANAHDADRFMLAYQNSAALSVTFDDMTITAWKPLLDQQRKWWNNGQTAMVFSDVAPPRFAVIGDGVVATIQSLGWQRRPPRMHRQSQN